MKEKARMRRSAWRNAQWSAVTWFWLVNASAFVGGVLMEKSRPCGALSLDASRLLAEGVLGESQLTSAFKQAYANLFVESLQKGIMTEDMLSPRRPACFPPLPSIPPLPSKNLKHPLVVRQHFERKLLNKNF